MLKMQKIRWGLIGGGKGSQIGPVHRLGAALDGKFEFIAGAFDINPKASKTFGIELGLAEQRSYGSWQDMLEKERKLEDKVELVTIATPNSTHFEIAKAFMESGFNILCEKPMTMTVEEADCLFEISCHAETIFAVNYGYSGFPLVRQMKHMITSGQLGKIRLVKAEFAHGHHADSQDFNNPRVRWRYNPDQAGASAVFADCGIHALHLVCFVTGQEVTKVSADFVSTVSSRVLEDDAMINFRMDGGIVGRLWTSAIAVGRQHGLTIQVFGENGGLTWSQEHPNQLFFMPIKGRLQVIERGHEDLSNIASEASRVAIGHSEGMPLAFANIYLDLFKEIKARKEGTSNISPEQLYPNIEAGLRSVYTIHAAKKSSLSDGSWMSAVPDFFKKDL